MGCIIDILFFCLSFAILTNTNVLCSNQSAAILPSSCSVNSYFPQRVVDVNCDGPLPDLSQMDFPHAPNLYQLRVRKCTFDWVPKSALRGFPILTNLFLECEKLVPEVRFEEGSLKDLPKLKVISMYGNVIKSLPKGMFCSVPALEKLYIDNNNISTSEILGFGDNCSSSYCENSIVVLKFSLNSIDNLPNRTFCSLRNLIYLELNTNGLRSIEEDALFNLESLRVLDLSFNQLTYIPATTFKPLKGLYNLDLDGNIGLNISGFLKHIPHLKGLFVPGIALEFLEKDVFQGLHWVESLMLYNNRLQSIHEDVFEPLIGVVDNVPNETEPTECDEDAITRLVFGGEFMYLIEKLTEVINVTGLRYLNLNGNNFTTVPPVRKLYKLLVFAISRNQIEILNDEDFNNLRKLQRLTLSLNRIRHISSTVFSELKCLKHLLLDNNVISYISDTAFDGLTALTELHLQHNQIRDIRGIFVKNLNLLFLNLSNNYLEELSSEMLPSKLIKLDVSHNSIVRLIYTPESLPKQVQMKFLDLSHNRINSVNQSFFSVALTDLYLHDNLISVTSKCMFCQLSVIINVTLHNNRLQTIYPNDLRINTLPVFQKTPVVSLGENDFICNCDLLAIRQFVYNQSYLQITNFESLPCRREYTKNRESRILIVRALPPEDFLCKIRYPNNASVPEACSIYRDFSWKYIIGDCSRGNLTLIPTGLPPGVRKLYLDGNNFSNVPNYTFQARVYQNLTELYLNGSQIEVIEDNTFVELLELTHLYLENNELEHLSNLTFAGLHQLVHLSLSFNNLMAIGDQTFHPLGKLVMLKLNDNQLRWFPVWNLDASKSLSSVTLSGNPWSCDCDYVQNFREWLQRSTSSVLDISSVSCKIDEKSMLEVPLIAFNASHCFSLTEPSFLKSKHFALMTGLITSLVLFTITSLVLYLYRKEMQVLIYSRYGVRIFHKNEAASMDGEKMFDAFLCYSYVDEDFVVEQLLPNLEEIEPPFRCCIHQRDFLVGGYITDNILEAVSKSRRSILVLTEAFISSEWCRFEFKTAYVQMLNDKCNRVIVIVVGKVPEKLDPEMKLYLKTNTYISWGDKLFWERLYFAMPDRVQMQELTHSPVSINNVGQNVSVVSQL